MGVFNKETKITQNIVHIANQRVISDWSLVEELCRDVNANDNGAKEAAKVLRKKMYSGTPQQQLNVITMIQSMMDRCGSRFKAELATTKFSTEIMETIWSDLTNVHVRIRLIERLGDWATKCRSDPSLASIPALHRKVLSNRYLCERFVRNTPPLVVVPRMTNEQKAHQILLDVDLADNNARMLQEAIAFTDPELEAVEENVLIKEFYSKCVTLHRTMQVYLAEVTESGEPNEICLAGILSANDELSMALRSHGQMMHRRQEVRALFRNNASGVGNGVDHYDNLLSVRELDSPMLSPREGNPVGVHREAAQTAEASAVSEAPESVNPFADEPYFVSGPSDVASVIRSGKQRDHGEREDDDGELSAKEREQLLQLLRDDSMGGSSSSGGAVGAGSSAAIAVV